MLFIIIDLALLKARVSICILAKSVAITFPIVTESTKFDAHIKFILLNLVTSFLGSPARKNEYVSNLFHFFDLLPLVSSENITIGRVNVSLPSAKRFVG